jgi:SAM-dependent methyltransferase
MNYLIEQYGDISVYWKAGLDGGGRSFGQQFTPIIGELIGRAERVFDFCAGAGFIGFSLLANGLCETLCLADVNPDAVEAARKTVMENGLDDKVTVYLSDCLKQIPDHERWDLVVGNPPHFCVGSDEEYKKDIIKFDHNWRIHKEFYREVRRFLKPRGSVILLENYSGSNESVFAPFLKLGRLELVRSFMYGDESEINPHYFLWARRECERIVSQDKEVVTLEVRMSELSRRFIERKCKRFEKVRIDVINDVDREARIGLQTRAGGPDIILKVPPCARKTSGIIMIPGGSLYISDLANRIDRICNRCE